MCKCQPGYHYNSGFFTFASSMSSSALSFKDSYRSDRRLVKCHNLNLAFSLSRKIIW